MSSYAGESKQAGEPGKLDGWEGEEDVQFSFLAKTRGDPERRDACVFW